MAKAGSTNGHAETRGQDYIIWQNRAFRFYLGARLCYRHEVYAPAAFCAQQSLETLVKATLVYWDRSFTPYEASHKFRKMLRTLRNKVPKAGGCEVPEYFFHDQRYQSVSRYPSPKGGLTVPATFLEDLDEAFHRLIRLVPFQFNSELIHLLASPDSPRRRTLTAGNRQARGIQQFLKVKRVG